MYRVQCPACDRRIKVNDKLFGRKVSCRCGLVLRIPADPNADINELDSVVYSCTECQKKLKFDLSSAGKMAKCSCGATSQVPTPVKLQLKSAASKSVASLAEEPMPDPLGDPLSDVFVEPEHSELAAVDDPLAGIPFEASSPFSGQSYPSHQQKYAQGQQSTKNKRSKSPGTRGEGNTIGLIGFIVSLVSLVLLCGLLSPISAILSVKGLYREPKGFAIAGLVISVIGCFGLFVITLTLISSFSQIKASVQIAAASAHVHNACVANDGVLPTQIEFENEAGSLADSIAYESFGNERFRLTHHGADRVHGTSDDLAREFVFDRDRREFVESR